MPTFDELRQLLFNAVFEDASTWYIIPKTGDPYDATVWAVDKGTKEVSYLDYPVFLCERYDDCTQVDDPESIWM